MARYETELAAATLSGELTATRNVINLIGRKVAVLKDAIASLIISGTTLSRMRRTAEPDIYDDLYYPDRMDSRRSA